MNTSLPFRAPAVCVVFVFFAGILAVPMAGAGPASVPAQRPLAMVNASPIALSLYAGQVRVLPQAGVERVAIGNGALLTASVVADKQIVLLGESAGVTSLYVWLRNGTQINYEVTVSADHHDLPDFLLAGH